MSRPSNGYETELTAHKNTLQSGCMTLHECQAGFKEHPLPEMSTVY